MSGATRIAGYASLFDLPDRGGDMVKAGAFAREIGRRGVPLLWQHDAARPIGRVESLAEDGRGLRVIASIASESQAGAEAVALLKSGAVSGLSFGYRVRDSQAGATGLRELTDVELVEVSVVTFPMQPLARVHAIEP